MSFVCFVQCTVGQFEATATKLLLEFENLASLAREAAAIWTKLGKPLPVYVSSRLGR